MNARTPNKDNSLYLFSANLFQVITPGRENICNRKTFHSSNKKRSLSNLENFTGRDGDIAAKKNQCRRVCDTGTISEVHYFSYGFLVANSDLKTNLNSNIWQSLFFGKLIDRSATDKMPSLHNRARCYRIPMKII